MPQVKDMKTGKVKHFRYTKQGIAMAEKQKMKNKKSSMSKYRRYA